jgi:hypothetical protein
VKVMCNFLLLVASFEALNLLIPKGIREPKWLFVFLGRLL